MDEITSILDGKLAQQIEKERIIFKEKTQDLFDAI
jgi:hypothetical protein